MANAILDARQEDGGYRGVELITGQRRRRRWTAEEKTRIAGGLLVQCDGYQVYEQLVGPKFSNGRLTLVSCWSHWRRQFFGVDRGGSAPITPEALERIAAL
jgi:transposase